MSFKSLATIECLLACPAICALAIRPLMLQAFEPNVASVVGKAFGNRVLSRGVLRAIHTASRQQTRKIRNPNAEHLLREDVIDTLLKAWYLVRQSFGETAGDLTQKHARLRARV